MKRFAIAVSVCFALTAGVTLCAQQPPQFPAEKEHAWLQQFVGEWESESEASMGPGQPSIKGKGAMSSRMLGEFWVVSEITGDIGGGSIHAIQTIGYDPRKKKYVGTWVDSMMNHMWKYEGAVDDSGKLLTLEAEGPNFMDEKKLTKFRDSYEFKSPDHIVATSSMQGEDGKWIIFMTGHIRRAK
ncbi:MAG: DUF1579 domain-containing protein [Planctomycetaceae bacterium]